MIDIFIEIHDWELARYLRLAEEGTLLKEFERHSFEVPLDVAGSIAERPAVFDLKYRGDLY